MDKQKKVLVVSPLKVLQDDQTRRFNKMEIRAAAVNGDTWKRPWLKKNIVDGAYQALFAGPEMCLEHAEFRKAVHTISKDIIAIIVDESHCISQWGGEFRPHYAQLERLRALVPDGTPVLAASATLNPQALDDVYKKLVIDKHACFHLNLGNDRPNISTSVHRMKGSNDLPALKDHLNLSTGTPAEIPKMLIFMNSVKLTQHGCRFIREQYPSHWHQYIDYIHAYRSRRDKRKVMRKFREGKIRILVATEAAGMGADIPDIEVVIQFGVPCSLSVFKQRIGRAGRSPDILARAILLVEEKMFARQKRRRKKKTDGWQSDDGDDLSDSDGEGDQETVPLPAGEGNEDVEEAPVGTLDDGSDWGKKVEEAMRRWIVTEGCERDYSDEYFNNPPKRTAPLGACCDRCIMRAQALQRDIVPEATSRPATPENSTSETADTGSVHSSPTKQPNANGKRGMTLRRPINPDGPATRRGEHLANVRAALVRWRLHTIKSYAPAPFTAAVLLPDHIITKIASNARLRTHSDLEELSPPWVWARKHGPEVLALLQKYDNDFRQSQEARKRAKDEEKRLEKDRRDHQAALEKMARQQQKQHEKNEEKRRKQDERERQARERAQRLALRPSQQNVNYASFDTPQPYFCAHPMPQSSPMYSSTPTSQFFRPPPALYGQVSPFTPGDITAQWYAEQWEAPPTPCNPRRVHATPSSYAPVLNPPRP